jgi:hypothetical protein
MTVDDFVLRRSAREDHENRRFSELELALPGFEMFQKPDGQRVSNSLISHSPNDEGSAVPQLDETVEKLGYQVEFSCW